MNVIHRCTCSALLILHCGSATCRWLRCPNPECEWLAYDLERGQRAHRDGHVEAVAV